MLVEPLAEVEVNVPGVMVILVAPDVAQLRVLAVPEITLAGFAVKEVIVGAEAGPGADFDEVDNPQPASAAQANKMRRRALRPLGKPRGPGLFPQKL